MLEKKYEVDLLCFQWVWRICCKDWSDAVPDNYVIIIICQADLWGRPPQTHLHWAELWSESNVLYTEFFILFYSYSHKPLLELGSIATELHFAQPLSFLMGEQAPSIT